jgi:hypothetical protein
MMQAIQSKVKEQSMHVKYDGEKKFGQLEAKFKSLLNNREKEWEKAWAKRDDLLLMKDSQIKELEKDRAHLNELLNKKEYESA